MADTITFRVLNDFDKKVRFHCINNNTNLTEYIKHLIEEDLKHNSPLENLKVDNTMEDTVQYTIRVTKEFHKSVKIRCLLNEISMRTYITHLIDLDLLKNQYSKDTKEAQMIRVNYHGSFIGNYPLTVDESGLLEVDIDDKKKNYLKLSDEDFDSIIYHSDLVSKESKIIEGPYVQDPHDPLKDQNYHDWR